MARGKYKKNYKKKFYKKRYRRMKKKYSKYKKSYKNGTMKVKGLKHKLDNKPEMKWTLSTWAAPFSIVSGATHTILWGNNYRWDATHYCIAAPSSGVSQSQFIGTQINSLYADVRFGVDINPDNMQAGFLRITVVRQRTEQDYSSVTFYPQPAYYTEPWDTKLWDVMWEKTYPLIAQLTRTKPIYLRFKIPVRQTITLKDGLLKYEYPIIIFGQCSTNNGCAVSQITSKFYYKDP